MDDDTEQERHFSVEFDDGATITLPAESWANQALVRAMLTEIRGVEPGRMTDGDWQQFVWSIADRNREEAS